MDQAQTGQDLRELWRRWLLPGITLLIFALFALGLRRELAEIHFANVLADLRSIARGALVGAVLCTAASYGLLGFYDVLALRYLGKFVPYGRTLFTSFIAYAFGHNFGIAAFTGGAVRYRLYYSAGLSAADVATVSAFCGVTTAIGLGVLAGVSFIVAPHQGAHAVHMNHTIVFGLGVLLLVLVGLYAAWSLFGPEQFELHGWALRAPAPSIALPQIALAVVDLAISALVLWLLLPAGSPVSLLIFAGAAPYTMDGELPGSRNEFIHWLQDVRDQRGILRNYTKYDNEIRTGRNVKPSSGSMAWPPRNWWPRRINQAATHPHPQ